MFRKKLSIPALAVLLVLATAVGYGIHYLIFRDAHHIGIFFISDVAFLPLEVLLVSLVLERIVEKSHKEENRGKINIIESIFFSESGSDMIRYLITCDKSGEQLCKHLDVDVSWKAVSFEQAFKYVKAYDFEIDSDVIDLFALHYHLTTRHKYFLKVIENPALADHETFTELVLEIHHLFEELDLRTDLYHLTQSDREYLAEIVGRVYSMLTYEWLTNVSYVQRHHTSRFSCLVRTNPFTTASPSGFVIE